MSKFEELKEQTATGLQYAIEQRKYTEIAVDLKPTYVLVPEKGVYTRWVTMYTTLKPQILFNFIVSPTYQKSYV